MAKINWLQALQDYITDDTMSYEKIAFKYGVTKQAVALKASEENWVQLRSETRTKLIQQTKDKAADEMAQRNILHANIGRMLTEKAVRKVEDKENPITPTSARDVREWIQAGVDIERRAYGMDRKDNVTFNISYQRPAWFTPPVTEAQPAETPVNE